MKDRIFGLMAIVGWISVMTGAIVMFCIGVTMLWKVVSLIGCGMFCSAFLYANSEGERDGVNR